jgi:predicted esterase
VSAGIDALAHEVRPARGEPDGALVLLHGRGAAERDLVPLLGELDPERRFVGVTPRAPLRHSGGFHGYVSRAVGHPDHDTFHRTYDLLHVLRNWLAGVVPAAQRQA